MSFISNVPTWFRSCDSVDTAVPRSGESKSSWFLGRISSEKKCFLVGKIERNHCVLTFKILLLE